MSLKTYRDWLIAGARLLREAGIEAPQSEARRLMQSSCLMSATELISAEMSLMPLDWLQTYREHVRRRAAGEPIAHILTEAHFYGLEFLVSRDVLIPRPDSETLVDEALARLPIGRESRIADLGTGSGCLLIAILRNAPDVTGLGLERAPASARMARRNLALHDLTDRGEILHGSWSDWHGWNLADMIIANPPYIPSATISSLERSVRDFEPRGALDGGEDGLDAYREIIALGADQMKPGAWLLFEIGYDQGSSVPELLNEAGFEAISVSQDIEGRDRVVSALRPDSE